MLTFFAASEHFRANNELFPTSVTYTLGQLRLSSLEAYKYYDNHPQTLGDTGSAQDNTQVSYGLLGPLPSVTATPPGMTQEL